MSDRGWIGRRIEPALFKTLNRGTAAHDAVVGAAGGVGALERLTACGYRSGERRVRLLATPRCDDLAQRSAAGLSGLHVVREALTRPCYDGLRFMIDVRMPDGVDLPLIDGGAFDWLQQLVDDRKLVFVASGVGWQLIVQLFRSS